MIKLNNDFLIEIGLGSLPPVEKNKMLNHIYETLEGRVGMHLAERMSEQQLTEFEGYIKRQDQQGALQWLESNFPDYRQVVADELEKLKSEIKQVAPNIVAQSQQQIAPQQVDTTTGQSQSATQQQTVQAQYPDAQQPQQPIPNYSQNPPASQTTQFTQPNPAPPQPGVNYASTPQDSQITNQQNTYNSQSPQAQPTPPAFNNPTFGTTDNSNSTSQMPAQPSDQLFANNVTSSSPPSTTNANQQQNTYPAQQPYTTPSNQQQNLVSPQSPQMPTSDSPQHNNNPENPPYAPPKWTPPTVQ